MRKPLSVSLPSRNAFRTSSTWPQIWGMTRIPAELTAISSGREIAPQISTSTPHLANSPARRAGSVKINDHSARPVSRPSASSITSRCAAASNTGETRPCQ